MDDLEALKEFRASLPAANAARVRDVRKALDGAIVQADLDARAKGVRLRLGSRGVWALAGSAATVAAALAVAVGILATSNDPVDLRPTDDIVYVDALVEFPYETASDVVSYADQVSLVTAISATVAPEDDIPAGEAGGGLVTRDVTFRIDRTLWHRSGAPALTGTFVANRGGWISQSFNDGPRVQSRVALNGAPWFEVGSQYVMPLALNKGKWTPIMPFAEFPYVDSRIRPAETQDTVLARVLRDQSSARITATFGLARPDAVAAEHYDLRPSERLNEVVAERED